MYPVTRMVLASGLVTDTQVTCGEAFSPVDDAVTTDGPEYCNTGVKELVWLLAVCAAYTSLREPSVLTDTVAWTIPFVIEATKGKVPTPSGNNISDCALHTANAAHSSAYNGIRQCKRISCSLQLLF